jgi:hypothetical protein
MDAITMRSIAEVFVLTQKPRDLWEIHGRNEFPIGLAWIHRHSFTGLGISSAVALLPSCGF